MGNLDQDADQEIIIGSDDGNIYALKLDGSAVPGWPASTDGDIVSSPALAELDGNLGLEVVVSSLDRKLYAWSSTGQLLTGWPKRLDVPLYASPSLADLHNSGRISVVQAGYDGRIYVFDLARKSLDTSAGWQQFRGGPSRQGHRLNLQ